MLTEILFVAAVSLGFALLCCLFGWLISLGAARKIRPEAAAKPGVRANYLADAGTVGVGPTKRRMAGY